MKLKVLFQSRKSLFSVPGGDTVQILKTAEALRVRGCKVDISTDLEPDVSNYDIIHLFNLIRPQEIYPQALNASRHKKKIALSTIYVSFGESDKKGRAEIGRFIARLLSPCQMEYAKALARSLVNREVNKGTLVLLLHGFKALQERVIEMTDVFLPNSRGEMGRVLADHPKSLGKDFVVVPNAADVHLFDPSTVSASPRFERYKRSVLCVARIESLKCQFELARAMEGLPWPLVLIGRAAPNHVAYYERIKRGCAPNVLLLGPVEHHLLPQYYSVAKVHALVSWFETTGLSSLEAGAMGCNLVITDKGDTREYFKDYAFYCQPDSIESIRRAIIQAHEAPANPELRQHILENYTWEKTAEKTMEGYEIALASA